MSMELEQDRPVGLVVCIHVGLDCIEVTCLEVVPERFQGKWHFLPARRRPKGKPLPGLFHAFESLAERFLEARGVGGSSNVWHLMWSTPWLGNVIEMLKGRPAYLPDPLSGLQCEVDWLHQNWQDSFNSLSQAEESQLLGPSQEESSQISPTAQK